MKRARPFEASPRVKVFQCKNFIFTISNYPTSSLIMSNQQIKLELTVEQLNTILEALGNMPSVKVESHALEIERQATPQLNGDSK